jgi:hypothetical protein
MKSIIKFSAVFVLALLGIVVYHKDSLAYHDITCGSNYIEGGVGGHTLSGYNCIAFEHTGLGWFNRSWGAWNPAGYLIVEEVEGSDRCDSTEPWDLRIADSDYAFNTQVKWVDAYGTTQDCGQFEEHELKSKGIHYWEDPSANPLREVWTYHFL